MADQEFILQPSSSMPVAIQGRVIARATSPVDDANLCGRLHTITVYESTQGELIASIEFHTKSVHELDFCLVERNLSLEEIPELLACQDPTEHVDRVHLRKQESCESKRLMKAIFQDYDSLGIEIEHQLQNFVPCQPSQPSPDVGAETKSVWSGWNPFGFDKR